MIRQLSEHIPDADVHIATYYPTALSLYISNVDSRKLFFFQDFPEPVKEVNGDYGLKYFELSLRLPFDLFLCNSSFTEGLVLKMQPDAKTIVIGVGVDLNVFRPRSNRLVDAKERKISCSLLEV